MLTCDIPMTHNNEGGAVELIGITDPQKWRVKLHGDSLIVVDGMAKGTLFVVHWNNGMYTNTVYLFITQKREGGERVRKRPRPYADGWSGGTA